MAIDAVPDIVTHVLRQVAEEAGLNSFDMACQSAVLNFAGEASHHRALPYSVRCSTIYFFMTVLDASGNIVAKCAQPGMSPKKLEVEVGTGVDLLAVMGLAGTVGASSGSAAGGLAGAGITT